jgi:hypothetical protein
MLTLLVLGAWHCALVWGMDGRWLGIVNNNVYLRNNPYFYASPESSEALINNTDNTIAKHCLNIIIEKANCRNFKRFVPFHHCIFVEEAFKA